VTGRRAAVAALIALALVATARSLGNGFAFDDVPIVVENAQVHTLAPPWEYARQSYWPPKNLGDAYRPWTVWMLALQYAVAGPAPWVFHLGNLLLTVALVLAVHALLHRVAPGGPAFAGAALFAVHPVHVEATANVVGQGELWMALFTVLAVLGYARARQADGPGLRARLGLAMLYVLAAAAKEQGIVLPALLLAWEALAVPGPPLRERVRGLLPCYLLLGLAGLAFLAARFLVLGDLGGGPPAAGLEGLGPGGRITVMLPLAAEWVRLLVWPRHLLAQYSPPGWGAAAAWGAAAWAGLGLLAALAWAAVRARRRVPAVALGIAWAGIAILPVSNILFPTGVLVAERTLLLPSVGVALAAAGLVGLATRAGSLPAAVAAAAVAALVAAGGLRSWSRQAVWKDNDTLFRQTLVDGPRSYRAWLVHGRELMGRGRHAEAKPSLARAGELYPRDRRPFEDLGFILRAEGRCDLAVPVLRRGVAAEPGETLARSRLFECLTTLGRHEEALGVAEDGVALGATEFEPLAAQARGRLAAEARR
jgi:protein O-mannosyl-transferase